MDCDRRIGDLARQHGFPLAGLTAVPVDGRTPRAEAFQDWLKRGLQGPLDYLSRSASQRVRLHERFPWAKSVLCLGAFHDGRPRGRVGLDLVAHVARYARGRDYHLVFGRRLKKLARSLVAGGLCKRTHWYVDTGPVLERAWAAAAGLGWIGKNNCLIHPQHGSYVLLGEILTDATAGTTRTLADRCGSCRRCLDACPTGALVAPRVLDASRCICTWNLEMKGVLAAGRVLHGWVAGCDLCQTACPFNALSRLPDADPELTESRWRDLTLAETIRLSRQEYDGFFRASALRRVGWPGLRLNAIRAVGRAEEESVRGALRSCRSDTGAEIRRAAEEALGDGSDKPTGSPLP